LTAYLLIGSLAAAGAFFGDEKRKGAVVQDTEHKSCGAPWVIGDEPVVVIDWYGASNYAKEKESHVS
jgi:hypothetical protein